MTPAKRKPAARAARRAPVYDVAVLGGGPAGATAARCLAAWGHRVIVLTRPAPGPPLAESLTPSVARVLRSTGFLDIVERSQAIRSTGHTVRWGKGDARDEPFATGELGWQVIRDKFDRTLLNVASDAGAAVHRFTNVRGVRVSGSEQVVSYEERGAPREVRAAWVIDSTGRSGLMARSGAARHADGPRTTAIVGVWQRPTWPVADWRNTIVESYAGGWAWSVPLSATKRQVTVMLDPSRTSLARGTRLRLTYREELARTKLIASLLDGAKGLGSPWARDATPYACERPVIGRVILAGDAASFVDPLSSFGIKKAMASAWLAAVVVRSVMEDASMESPALSLVARREHAMVAGLRRAQAELAREAARAHEGGYWQGRETDDPDDTADDPDMDAIRSDASVRKAYDAIRAARHASFIAATKVARVPRAVVEGDRVVVRDHLVLPAFPDGVRYIRNVDLVRLAELAPTAPGVPGIAESYVKVVGPARLPDIAGALAVLVAGRVVALA